MSSDAPLQSDVVIVGGGLAGLAAACRLTEANIPFVLLEASDRLGGRVRTEHVEGFTFDHGFQVLLTAYPACQRLLDYDALRLQRFDPGALLQLSNGRKLLSDPWRRPTEILSTLGNRAGTLADKVRVGLLRHRLSRCDLQQIYNAPEQSTRERLRAEGFSDRFIDAFWRPFLGGIFLDPELQTSSRMFEFVFKMFSSGDAALPAAGMEAIPQQLAAKLPPEAIHLRSTVAHLDEDSVSLTDGRRWKAGRGILIATDASAAARLLNQPPPEPTWRSVATLYFSADQSPLASPHLLLASEPSIAGAAPSVINNLAVLSDVAPQYAPEGQALISVSVLRPSGDGLQLELPVREQLRHWFGDATDHWHLLRSFFIPFALPAVPPGVMEPVLKPCRISAKHFRCGDHLETPSLHGALNSGLRAVAELLAP